MISAAQSNHVRNAVRCLRSNAMSPNNSMTVSVRVDPNVAGNRCEANENDYKIPVKIA